MGRAPCREAVPLPACPAVMPVTPPGGAPPSRPALRRAPGPRRRWDRRRVRTAPGLQALEPPASQSSRPSAPGGRRTGRPRAARPAWLPAGTASAGRPARFQAAVHGAHRALAVTLARNDARATAARPAADPSSRGSAAGRRRRRTRPSARGTARRWRADQPGPADQPADPGVRPAPRLQRRPVDTQVLGVVSAPTIQRVTAPTATPGVIGGSLRTTVCPAAVSSATTASTTVARVAASARTPGTGDRVETPIRSGRPGSASGPGPPRQHRVRDGEVGHRRRSAPFSAMPDQLSAPISAGTTPRPGLRRDQPARGRRQAERAHAVVAVGQGHRAGRDGRGAAAGAAAATGRCSRGCG